MRLLPILLAFVLILGTVHAGTDELVLIDVLSTNNAYFYLYRYTPGYGLSTSTPNLMKVGDATIRGGAAYGGTSEKFQNQTRNRTYESQLIAPGTSGYLAGDVDGDGVDELISVDTVTSRNAYFYFYKYRNVSAVGTYGGYATTTNLDRMGDATIRGGAIYNRFAERVVNRTNGTINRFEIGATRPTTSGFLFGDVDGDGVDELVIVDTVTSNNAVFFVYKYKPGAGGDIAPNFEKVGEWEIRNGAIYEWQVGDVDGDGTDELVQIDTTTSNNARFAFYGLEKKETEAIRPTPTSIGSALYRGGTFYTWRVADVDGDGKDEIIAIDTATSNNIRLYFYKYAPGVGESSTRPNLARISGGPRGYVEDAVYRSGAHYGVTFGNLVGEGLQPPPAEVTVIPPEGPGVEGPLQPEGRPPRVELLYPLGGESLTGAQEVRWEASDPDDDPVLIAIEYSSDGGESWKRIADGLENKGSYTWDTTKTPDGRYILAVRGRDPGGLVGEDISGPFELDNTRPVAELLEPTAARLRSLTRVSWRASDPGGEVVRVNLSYSPDRGKSWYPLVLDAWAEGTFLWDTSSFPNGQEVLLALDATDGVITTRTQSRLFTMDQRDYGSTAIASEPTGAAIYVDGRWYGDADKVVELPAGTSALRLEKAGYLPWEGSITISPGQNPAFKAVLTPSYFGFSPEQLAGMGAMAVLGILVLALGYFALSFVLREI